MIKLSPHNSLKVIDHLKSTEAWKPYSYGDIAAHLDKLNRDGQFDAVETADGELVYAWAWYRLTYKAFDEYKQFIPPKRVNRGSHCVALFGMNNMLDVPGLLRLIRNTMRRERAKTFTIYTRRGKWVTMPVKQRTPHAERKKRKMARQFFEIIGKGNELCQQQ